MVKVSIFEVVANLVVISDVAALSVFSDTVSKTNVTSVGSAVKSTRKI